jgi:NAD(P)-dependent dehydrogenase (short-subunit alcohol dehydrogenase family)
MKPRARRWTTADIPPQEGRIAVVTGANAGIGFEIARMLASQGAHVVLACRDLARAASAAGRITAGHPAARTTIVELDLASLASVRAAAETIRAGFPRVDLLINNAGIMEVPFQRSRDGFELHLATNHLGPFALTGLILDRLLPVPGSRIVTMSSQGHVDGVLDFADLDAEPGYQPADAYHRTKLANLLFTYELDRRLRTAGARTAALAAHPGVVATDLFKNRSRLGRAALSPRLRVLNFGYVQSIPMGALPALRAATDPVAHGGEFYGPRRKHDTGHPVVVTSSAASHDAADQARLWAVSQELTGVCYPIAAAPASA